MSDLLPFAMPENACNAHLHIIDPTYPNDGKAAAHPGSAATYREVAKKIQMPRAVFVQPKTFALDNSCLIDAIKEFEADHVCKARGIAVVNSSVSDEELQRLHDNGVRGLRFSLWNPSDAVVSFEDCFPLSERIKHLGWNIQLHMGASQIVKHADIIRKLDCKVVIDHMGRLDPKLGTKDPAYSFLKELIDRGRTWIKLSGPYINTVTGYPWNDAAETAKEIAAYAPERVVFGTDFPNTLEKIKRDPLDYVRPLADWIPSEQLRKLALVDNPEELYGF